MSKISIILFLVSCIAGIICIFDAYDITKMIANSSNSQKNQISENNNINSNYVAPKVIYHSEPAPKEPPFEDIIALIPPEIREKQRCEPIEEIEIDIPNRFPPAKVLFDASGSSAPCGRLVKYIWDFGDGTVKSGKNVSHTYTKPGSYDASLTLVDNKGNQTLMKTEYVVLISNRLSITGRITDEQGRSVEGVTLYIQGEKNTKLQTSKTGNFTITNAASGFFHRVTPKKKGYRFFPENEAFANLNENKIVSFVAIPETN